MKKFSFDIPIFPLSGAILLPKANLPLNIFEERYISMVDYALSHDKIIGIIQTMGNNNKLFKIGSIGEITSFHKTDDGRYLINLFGIDLFKTTKEIESDNKFRIFNVECKNKKSDESIKIKENFNKLLLIEKFKLFVKKSNPEIIPFCLAIILAFIILFLKFIRLVVKSPFGYKSSNKAFLTMVLI